MPSRWAGIVIVTFWAIMTAELFRRDVLPKLGYGEVGYRQVLSDRVLQDDSNWIVLWEGERIGSTSSEVRRNEDGTHLLGSKTVLETNTLGDVFEGASKVIIDSQITVSPLGRLQSLHTSSVLEGTGKELSISGTVEEDVLRLRIETKGQGLSVLNAILGNELQVKIDPEAFVLDALGSIDRLPNLRVGKTWNTRIVNPLGTAFSPAGLLGDVAAKTEVIPHRVVRIEPIQWNETQVDCYMVEHRHPLITAHTWVRVDDGRVIRHEVPFLGSNLTLELEP